MLKKPDDDQLKSSKMTLLAWSSNRVTATPKLAVALASAKTTSIDGSDNNEKKMKTHRRTASSESDWKLSLNAGAFHQTG
jgi:hypothetical protein